MSRLFGLIFASSLVAACSSAESPATGPVATSEGAESIPGRDDPRDLAPGTSFRLGDVLAAGDVGRTFSVAEDRVPYPDTWWAFDMQDPNMPFARNGIDMRWQLAYGLDEASPLEKYMGVTNAPATGAAKAWEEQNHGAGVPGVARWFGHCNGWTGAAIYNKPVTHAVLAAPDGHGGVRACNAGEAGCTKFEIGDINALQAEAFVNADASFIGSRCDVSARDIDRHRDHYGRVTGDTGCRGVNPGALLVVAAHQIKDLGQAFAIDAQTEVSTDQIWNQPAYAYRINEFQPLRTHEAIKLVARSGHSSVFTIPPFTYKWNRDAKGFALVDVSLFWVSEVWPSATFQSGHASTKEMHMRAIIELDRDANDPDAQIIGGEYLDEPRRASEAADYSRLTVPPFVWTPKAPGADGTSGEGHNPYVSSAIVQKLVQLGQ